MDILRIIIRSTIIILTGILFLSCEIPAPLSFPAHLNVRNSTDRVIYITPIGVNSRGEFHLLPVLKKKKEDYVHTRKKTDFKILSSTTITITFDHDDVQFSGIILVSDHKRMKGVIITKDMKRGKCCYPPIEDLYVITEDMLKDSEKRIDEFRDLFDKFKIK